MTTNETIPSRPRLDRCWKSRALDIRRDHRRPCAAAARGIFPRSALGQLAVMHALFERTIRRGCTRNVTTQTREVSSRAIARLLIERDTDSHKYKCPGTSSNASECCGPRFQLVASRPSVVVRQGMPTTAPCFGILIVDLGTARVEMAGRHPRDDRGPRDWQ